MKRGLVTLIGIISMLVQVCMASDYDYLLNSSTMTVGQTVGENLMVREGCPDPDTECQDSEKIRFVSATPGRLGRIEFSINLFKDFDISVNIDDNSLSNGIRLGESITLHTGGYITTLKFTQDLGAYSVDGTSFSSSNPKDTGYSGESRWKGGFAGWQEGYAVNDIRIVVIDGRAEAHINEAIIPGGTGGITLGNPSQRMENWVGPS